MSATPELYTLSATDIVRLLREGLVTPLQLVEAVCDRIQASHFLQPPLSRKTSIICSNLMSAGNRSCAQRCSNTLLQQSQRQGCQMERLCSQMSPRLFVRAANTCEGLDGSQRSPLHSGQPHIQRQHRQGQRRFN